MKKQIIILAAILFGAISCEKEYSAPSGYKRVTLEPTMTIKELKELYTKPGNPVNISSDIIIGGQVTTSDEAGNFYRGLYIQDTTAAIELKIGRTSLYNDFKIGQWVYVKCKGLTLGDYNGMLQLGYKDEKGKYETAYLDSQYLIDAHVFRGEMGVPIEPERIDEKGLKNTSNCGRLVTVPGAKYGNEIFVILYDDKTPNNSIYLSKGGNFGVTTWAMSENKFKEYMTPNGLAVPQSAFNGAVTPDVWQNYYNAAESYTVSQYFKVGQTDLQVRTSGYSRFADKEISDEILNGATVEFTGILTYYKDNIQFTLIDIDGVKIQ